MKKIILYNILILSILYTTIEILSGIIIYNKIDCHYVLCNKSYTFKNEFGFYKEGKSFYKRDEFGLRGKRKKLSDVDILTIGGSTTDERYVNVEDTWSEILEYNFVKNDIDIDVVNAGIDGQSTIGHIWNFENWFAKLKNFKPKYIIFYIGLNERLMKYEASKYELPSNNSNLNIINRTVTILKKNNGITYRLYNIIYKNYFYKETIDAGHKLRNPDYKISKKKYNLNESQKNYLYKNLTLLMNYSKNINAIPIFINQKSLRGVTIDGNNHSISDFNEYDILFYEKQIADIIEKFCIKNNLKFIDLFNEINFENDDFYDLIHTTPKGSKKVANFIFEKLNDELILN